MQISTAAGRLGACVIAAMLALAPFVFYAGPGSFTIPRMAVIEIAAWVSAAALIIVPAGKRFPLKFQAAVFISIYMISFALSGAPLVCVKTFVFFLSCAVLSWCVFMIAGSDAIIRRFCIIIVAAGAMMSVHGLFQFLGMDFQVLKGIEFRMFATAGTPAALAGYTAVCMCILAAAIFKTRPRPQVIGLYVLWALFSVCLSLTASRSGLAAFAVGASVTAVSSFGAFRENRKLFTLKITACVLVFAAAIAVMFLFFSPHALNALASSPAENNIPVAYGSSDKSGSIRQRAFTLRCGYEMWKSRPIIGSGPGTFAFRYPLEQARLLKDNSIFSMYGNVVSNRIATHAHNEYLELAVEGGVFGAAAFIALAFSALFVIFKRAKAAAATEKNNILGFGIAGAFAALLTQSAFEFALHDPLTGMIFWVLLGLGCAMAPVERRGEFTHAHGAGVFRVAALTVIAAFIIYAPTPYLAMRHMMLANALGRSHDVDAALEEFDIAEKLDPSAPEILLNRASAHRATGDVSSAKGDLKRALTLSNNPEIYNSLGKTYAAAGLLPDAEAAFLTTLSIDPWKVSTHLNLAQLYDSWGRADDAILHAQKAVELSRGYPQREQALLQYLYKLKSAR